MRDWQELVRQRLVGLELDPAEREEVRAELATHLEESYEILCKQGLGENEAARRTFEQVSNWHELERKISAVKRREYPMKQRVQQLWIPGFLTLVLSIVFDQVFYRLGFRSRIIGSGTGAIFLYVPWLMALPFVGALGAYVSSRAGGSRGTMVLASVFPVAALTLAFLLMFPIGMIIQWVRGTQGDFSVVATVLLKNGIGGLLAPGAALILGGLVASVLFRRRPPSHKTAIGSEMTHA